MIYNGYSNLSNLQATCRTATKNLRKHLKDFDGIVVRGYSGVLIGTVVSLRLKRHLVVIRKAGYDKVSHGQPVIGAIIPGKRYLFLDDFISMGKTRMACQEAILKQGALITHQYEYRDHSYRRVPK